MTRPRVLIGIFGLDSQYGTVYQGISTLAVWSGNTDSNGNSI